MMIPHANYVVRNFQVSFFDRNGVGSAGNFNSFLPTFDVEFDCVYFQLIGVYLDTGRPNNNERFPSNDSNGQNIFHVKANFGQKIGDYRFNGHTDAQTSGNDSQFNIGTVVCQNNGLIKNDGVQPLFQCSRYPTSEINFKLCDYDNDLISDANNVLKNVTYCFQVYFVQKEEVTQNTQFVKAKNQYM